ncbi:2-nitropropane dioxygenase [Tothia fuscella]|uniref:2-nitropropane dioxygenase n=1 Tax=Tothia fuscella TaxID=1048955 RepID=A0A9P4U084_9PEZI|nr:2-nitropropane dioxygenase [Tothia fuscella]
MTSGAYNPFKPAPSKTALQKIFPWTEAPLVASAPMRLISLAPLAVEVSKAGGLGFIGSGNDQSNLEETLKHALKLSVEAKLPIVGSKGETFLPIGVGFLNWGADLEYTLTLLKQYRPVAVWFFAPRSTEGLVEWTTKVRETTFGITKIWIQIGSVKEAVEVVKGCKPDALVVQGADAGGHGLNNGAGLISLLPEVIDTLETLVETRNIEQLPTIIAAGGIADGRGVAASLALGAEGVVMGTRYLAANEAQLSPGYRNEVLRASDGGQTTVRSSVYDTLRGTTEWPKEYGGRGVVNKSYHDSLSGMSLEENKKLYDEAVGKGDEGWGESGRLTTYAGTCVGLVKKVQGAGETTKEVRLEADAVLRRLKG